MIVEVKLRIQNGQVHVSEKENKLAVWSKPATQQLQELIGNRPAVYFRASYLLGSLTLLEQIPAYD